MSDQMPPDPAAPPNLLRTGTPDLSSMNYAFTSGSLSPNLSAEKQTDLVGSIEAIFQSEEGEASHEDQEMSDVEDEEPEVNLEDRQKRTDQLKSILPTLAQLWWCRSEHMELATEKLADASRNGESGPCYSTALHRSAAFIFPPCPALCIAPRLGAVIAHCISCSD